MNGSDGVDVDLIPHHDAWDAGDLACGPMLLALKSRLERLALGQVFEPVTRDEVAPVDVPAWCWLTGHRLVHAAHPHYHLELSDSVSEGATISVQWEPPDRLRRELFEGARKEG